MCSCCISNQCMVGLKFSSGQCRLFTIQLPGYINRDKLYINSKGLQYTPAHLSINLRAVVVCLPGGGRSTFRAENKRFTVDLFIAYRRCRRRHLIRIIHNVYEIQPPRPYQYLQLNRPCRYKHTIMHSSSLSLMRDLATSVSQLN